MATMTLTQADLDAQLAKVRSVATVRAKFLRQFVGGQPAKEEGVRAFVQHQALISPDTPEFEAMVQRILKEEIGDKEKSPEGAELQESSTYGVNVIRHSVAGPYIAAHQIQACIKQAASRLGLFMAKRGAKGDLAELGTVRAVDSSLADESRPWEIALTQSGAAAHTSFQLLSGSVSTPMGRKSIQYHAEMADEGSEFAFEIHWPATKIRGKDMGLILAAATQIGLGSCLSLGFGRWEVLDATIEIKKGKEDEKEE